MKLILASTSSLLREVFTFKLNRRKSVAFEVELANRYFLNLFFEVSQSATPAPSVLAVSETARTLIQFFDVVCQMTT